MPLVGVIIRAAGSSRRIPTAAAILKFKMEYGLFIRTWLFVKETKLGVKVRVTQLFTPTIASLLLF
jgi:hypothetical protein